MTYTKEQIEEAKRKQQEALDKTALNLRGGFNRKEGGVYEQTPCEVCGELHHNYQCCETCNYDEHKCHFCGDPLGHTEVSVCYLLPD